MRPGLGPLKVPINGHGTFSSDETSLLRENLMPCRLIGTDSYRLAK